MSMRHPRGCALPQSSSLPTQWPRKEGWEAGGPVRTRERAGQSTGFIRRSTMEGSLLQVQRQRALPGTQVYACPLPTSPLLFFKDFYLFIFKEENINVWLPLECSLLGTWPATQACALTGNRISAPLVHSLALHPLSHTSQGPTSPLGGGQEWQLVSLTLLGPEDSRQMWLSLPPPPCGFP